MASLCNIGVLKTFMCKSPTKPIIWLFFISKFHFFRPRFMLFFILFLVLWNMWFFTSFLIKGFSQCTRRKLAFAINFAMLLTFVCSPFWLLNFFHPHDFHVWLLCFVRGFHLNNVFLEFLFFYVHVL
jgi:hypothetical protein